MNFLEPAMIKLPKAITTLAASTSAAPRESVAAGHGLHRSFSRSTAPATLPPERRGRLKNGNRSGDFLAAPRCGARTRCGGACRQPAMTNGRCRMHGGLSTGPRTPEGLARSRRARLTHGARSAGMRALMREACAHMRRSRALRARLIGSSAGHGAHRPKSSPSPVGAGFKLVLGPAEGRTRGPARTPSTLTPVSAPVAPSPTANSIGVHLRSSAAQSLPLSAGHGVDRSFSIPTAAFRCTERAGLKPAPTPSGRRAHLCSSTSSTPASAGHGVDRSIFDSRPALR
jgi:hypothetical protein